MADEEPITAPTVSSTDNNSIENNTETSPEVASKVEPSEVTTTVEEPDPLEKKIIRQIEFYFGERNLCRDKFLQNKIKEDKDGWVELSVLLTFNRLKALSTDCAVIAGALRKSTSGLLEVSEDGLKIRRKSSDPVPTLSLLSPETRKEMNERTLHIKGFPLDATLDDIQEFILPYGETVLIKMKRSLEKAFKGSIFVEFKSKDSITKLISARPDIKYGEETLKVETKMEYYKRKDEEKKKAKAEKTKDDSSNSSPAPPVASKEDVVRQTEAVLQFKGCGDNTTREDLKEYFRQFSSVAWVDFQKGDTEGYIRFEETGGAKKAYDGAMEKVSEGETLQLCGGESTIKLLEGEEEVAYWQKMAADQLKRKTSGRRGGRGGGRGGGRSWGRGGGGRGGKRRSYSDKNDSEQQQEEPPSKSVKLDNNDDNES